MTDDQNLCNDDSLFNIFWNNHYIEHDIGKTNKIETHSLLIDVLKEMSSYLEDHCFFRRHIGSKDFFNKKW